MVIYLYIFLKLAVRSRGFIKPRFNIVGKTMSWRVLCPSVWRQDYITGSIMFFHNLIVTLSMMLASMEPNQFISGCTVIFYPSSFISCNNSIKRNFAHSHPLAFCHPMKQFILEVQDKCLILLPIYQFSN